MLESLTISDLAWVITSLGVVFGLPFAFAKYTNNLKGQLKEMQGSIERLEENFNNKINQLKDDFNLKNKNLMDELAKTTKELEKSNNNNRVLYKVVKVLLDYEAKTSQDAELKEIKSEFDEITINTATQLK